MSPPDVSTSSPRLPLSGGNSPSPAGLAGADGKTSVHANGATPFAVTSLPFGTTVAPFNQTSAPIHAAPKGGHDELTLGDLGPLVRQLYTQIRTRWLAGLLAAVLVATAATWLFFHTIPEYTAETTLLAQSPLDKILNPGEGTADGGQIREENTLRNHLSVMTSRTFMKRLAESMSPQEIAAITTPYIKKDSPPDDDLLLTILNTKIDIERERGRDFFTITVRHRTPAVAVMIAEKFTSQYLLFIQAEYRATSVAAMKILQEQADALNTEMRQLEDERRDYRKTYNLISVEENQSIISERLRRINAALSDVRVQRVGFETQLRQAKADMTVTNTPYSNPVLAGYGNNQALRIELDRMRAQREVFASEYGPNHPKMIEANRVLAGLQQTLEGNFQLAMADLQGKLDLAVASETQLNNELTAAFSQSLDIDKLASRFNTLGDELTAKRKTQTELLQRISRTALSGQMPADVMRVVDPAYLRKASLKKQLLMAALVTILAGMAFIGTPLLIHLFDERLSAGSDLETILGKDLLGAVPRLNRTRVEDRPHLVRDNVDFASVEAFLSVVGQLELLSKKPLPKRILITSTLPGEGKSMIASNLAATFTRLGRRTLLVDCDFRRPTQSQLQRAPDGRGLLTWATGGFPPGTDLFEIGGTLGLVKLPDGTYFLPAGGTDTQPTRHLITSSMFAAFERLSESFDVVIVDTPPAGVFQDALILAKYCHETILVARDGKAQTAQVKRIVVELQKTQAPIVGVVLNGFAPGATHPQMAYRHLADKYGYGYNKQTAKAPAKTKK